MVIKVQFGLEMLDIITVLRDQASELEDTKLLLREAADEIEYLYSLLKRAYKYVEFDAHMMNSISRFSPLPQEVQEIHDNTEYASEKLLKELNAKGIY